MKLQTKTAYAALCLFLVFVGGLGGCLIGSNIGHSIDVKNGAFGKPLEGSPNALSLLLLGWVLGMAIGVVAFIMFCRKRRAK